MALNLVPKLITEGKALGRITETIYGFDHFDGKVVDSSTEGAWNDIATGAGDGPTLLADEVGGVIQIDPDSAGTAVGGLAYERNFRASQQNERMVMEVKFKINTDLTNRYFYVGWTDDSSTAENPVLLAASAAYGVTAATDTAGVIFHTVGHATNAYLVGVNNATDVGSPTQIPGFTMTADRWVVFRCEIDDAGNAYGSATLLNDAQDGGQNDMDVGQATLPLAVATGVNLCPIFLAGSVAAASTTFYEVDYAFFGGTVRAIAA